MAIKSLDNQQFKELPVSPKISPHKQYHYRMHALGQEELKVERKKEKRLQEKIELKKITEEIHNERKIQKICSEIIFRRLFVI